MKWIFILLAGFLVPSLSSAQNWQTVNQFDTNYFSAGEHSSSGGRYFQSAGQIDDLPTSSLLRLNYVTNVVGMGGDSSFFFFKTLRDTAVYIPSGKCVDTVAPSWLGSFMLRKSNGDELYFKSYRDTIFIPTQSTFGSNWILGKDTAGNIFRGSITAVGTLQVDGVLDSFKTISIQAYSGTTPIANPYNNKILQLSKAHGWLQTLDFFRFPNKVYYSDKNPIATDSTQHLRLPKKLMYPGPNTEDLAWKYAPGNEWIWQDERDVSNNPDASPQSTIVTHDSVTAFSLLSPSVGLATFKSVKFWKYHVFVPPSAANPTFSYNDSISYATILHTDTVRSIPSAPFVFIEHGNVGRYNYEQSYHSRYFVNDFDSSHYFITRSDLPNLVTRSITGCIALTYTLSAPDDKSSFETYMPGFGKTAIFYMNSFNGNVQDRYIRAIYIKIGSSIYGTKVDVTKLGVEPLHSKMLLSISPNPASDFIKIAPASGSMPLVASLYNITGQLVRSVNIAGSNIILKTSDIPAGLYFLQVTDGREREKFKVVVRH